MRTIIAVVVMCVVSGPLPVCAAQPAGGVLTAAAVREATRLASVEVEANQQPAGSTGHPVLIGAVIGAAAGAVAGYASTSCSVPPPNDVPACGTHYKAVGAAIGAGLGAAVGAVIGFVFRR